MSYKQIKWLILATPPVSIGLWEYLRHTVLLSYLSMELGNLLTPLLLLLITVTLLRKLFHHMEHTNDELRREQALKAALEQREQLARELHDGISQSLFLLSVRLDKLEQADTIEETLEQTGRIRETVRHVYEDVRQSIAGLRSMPTITDRPWMQSIYALQEEIRSECGLEVELDWHYPDALLSAKQKVELLSILREALLNVRKHASASKAVIRCMVKQGNGQEPMAASYDGMTAAPFECVVMDDGVGVAAARLHAPGCYGLRMMESRARAMGWKLTIKAADGQGTVVRLSGNGG